ncbi:antitoxin HicB [Microbacterium arborescens]
MSAREFEVTVERDGKWWVFEIPELHTGGQARTLADVDGEARGVITAWLSIEDDTSFTVAVTVPGQAAILEEWAAAQRDEEAAREAQARAAERRRAVVRELRVT